MIYLYDNAICDDLRKSFNPNNVQNPVVTVISSEQAIAIAAQIQEDKLRFPLVALVRKPNSVQIDQARMNFSRAHFGVCTVIDNKTNDIYYEKAIPVTLEYSLTVLTTSIADQDEIIRELLFKYINQYFLKIKLPYESDRKVRFGVRITSETDIDYSSGTTEYYQTGSLYQAIIPLKCDGCVLVTYTPVKLKREVIDKNDIKIV
jgi:hypothetical protein